MEYETTGPDSGAQTPVGTIWGPGLIDNAIREAICHCWLVMPPEKRTAHTVEIEIRRLVDRALKDLHEDARAFGVGGAEKR